MAKIGAGTANATDFFNLNGLDYSKGLWQITYSNVLWDSNKDVDVDELQIGISSAYTDRREDLQHPIKVTDWEELNGTPYSDLSTLLNNLHSFLGLSPV